MIMNLFNALKDDNLIPENIKNGVEIDGVVGSLISGTISGSTSQSRSSSFTIQHSLGRVPNVAILIPRDSSYTGLLWTFIVRVGDNQYECQYTRGSSGTVASDQFHINLSTNVLAETYVTFSRVNGFNTSQYFQQTYDYFIG